MKSVIEQLQELMVRLEELGKATIATYTQAPGGGIELSPARFRHWGRRMAWRRRRLSASRSSARRVTDGGPAICSTTDRRRWAVIG